MQPLNIGTEKAEQKIKHFCVYQERCHQEITAKLYSYGLGAVEVNTLLAMLIEENYLDEERFAVAYAGGKFRINHWGKYKIKMALKQKMVSEYCISKALTVIEHKEYLKSIDKLAKEKLLSLVKEKNILVKKNKLLQHLIQKGYEQELIYEWINNNL